MLRILGNRIEIPVPADKNAPLIRWKPLQKSVDRPYKFPAVHCPLHVVRVGYELRNFIQHSRGLSAASFLRGMMLVSVQGQVSRELPRNADRTLGLWGGIEVHAHR